MCKMFTGTALTFSDFIGTLNFINWRFTKLVLKKTFFRTNLENFKFGRR